ncbi:hypothetical protein Srubr_19230 [Streptomyces rubradiris]|uniref:Uncharacterized protein n=1 Tax=Streptomyces rubradiris TaxID=285531 RepID=A0ABQ3R8A2_STRRR|nr:hypothetical protein GCM10018792_58970 [Streptomyces rubradiris]GHI52077.1 hypothetical protein Srubr_19230 [Streptomyces rubradiris]
MSGKAFAYWTVTMLTAAFEAGQATPGLAYAGVPGGGETGQGGQAAAPICGNHRKPRLMTRQ